EPAARRARGARRAVPAAGLASLRVERDDGVERTRERALRRAARAVERLDAARETERAEPREPVEHQRREPVASRHAHACGAPPRRARGEMMEEHALADGDAREAGTVEDAAVPEHARVEAHGMEHAWHRARRVDRRREIAVAHDVRATCDD